MHLSLIVILCQSIVTQKRLYQNQRRLTKMGFSETNRMPLGQGLLISRLVSHPKLRNN